LRHVIVTALLLVVIGAVVATLGSAVEIRPWGGDRTTPVHWLPLIDEDGEQIVPTYRNEMPFSVRNTCGPCHDYSTISTGLHFNSFKGDVPPGRPGEPWIWVDELTGTQLPLSYRSTPGTWRPDELGITPWRFTQIFGRHMLGGDAAEPQDEFADPKARWTVSGKAEINCLGCHSASPRHDQSAWAIQMARENFRWAGTAASGLGEVTGMAYRVPGTWTVHDGPNPDDTRWAVPPSVRYDPAQFDTRQNALFDIVRTPEDKRCLYCHSVSAVDRQRWEVGSDVHSAAGMQCADCHRNGLNHMMVRGYENEALEQGDRTVAEFSCRGCHLGASEAQDPPATVGRLGAPRPIHKGLPPIHLDKLSCTVCHSGALPEATPTRVRTSRANRLGIYGKAVWHTDAPYIAEPVFLRGGNGKLEPHRVAWPAFWGRLEGENVKPLLPDEVAPVAEGILDPEQQVGRVLAAMSTALAELVDVTGDPETGGEAVLVASGKVYHCDVDGRLDVTDYTGEMAITTPLWAREKDGEVFPLVPDFDPTAEVLELEVEDPILTILGGLELVPAREGEPVAVFANKVYRRTLEDLLEVLERPDVAGDALTWGWRQDDTISPVVPEFVVRAVVETAGIEQSLSEEQVVMVLKALADAEKAQTGESGEFVYVSGGKTFSRGPGGALVASDHAAAEPYFWPIAHNVRPAAQSLGAKYCTDCHAADAPFFFGTVKSAGPLRTDDAVTLVRYEVAGLDPLATRLFGWSFTFRPLLKTIGFLASALVLAILLAYGLPGLRQLCKRLGQRV